MRGMMKLSAICRHELGHGEKCHDETKMREYQTGRVGNVETPSLLSLAARGLARKSNNAPRRARAAEMTLARNGIGRAGESLGVRPAKVRESSIKAEIVGV